MMRPYYTLWGDHSFSIRRRGTLQTLLLLTQPRAWPLGGNLYNGIVIPGSHFPNAAQGHVPADILANPQASLTERPGVFEHHMDGYPAPCGCDLPGAANTCDPRWC